MTTPRLDAALVQALVRAVRHRCGYCLTSEIVTGAPLEIEHLLPVSLGGPTVEANLWLACRLCNAHKSDRVNALDRQTDAIVPLFNPRRDRWEDHFRWSSDGLMIEPLTAVGRATLETLKLNRAPLVTARKVWVQAGWHPPRD